MKFLNHAVKYAICCFSLPCHVIYAAEFSDDKTTIKFGSAQVAKSFRKVCEDVTLTKFSDEFPIAGIFDGHNGTEAARYAQEYLPKNIYDACCKNGLLTISDENIESAFHMTNEAICELPKDPGSTAVVAFFNRHDDKNTIMHIAHIGDSRAILGFVHDDGKIRGEQLTHDHRPDNESEKTRIEQEKLKLAKSMQQSPKRKINPPPKGSPPKRVKSGTVTPRVLFSKDKNSLPLECPSPECDLPKTKGKLISISQDITPAEKCRVSFGLGVTRGFGHPKKRNKGFTATPEIKHVSLDEKHRFVILYSDGVGDHITAQEAAQHVYEKLKITDDLDEVALSLLEKAARNDPKNPLRAEPNYRVGMQDDASVVVIIFK